MINNLFVRSRIAFFEPLESQLPVRFDRAAVERAGPDGAMLAYYRYTLPLEYRAARPGAVGPMTVQMRGGVFTGVQRGPRGLEAETRDVFAVSEPISIQVQSLPRAGQPATFSGGVGSFKATASAQPTRVRVGDPIELTVRVSGRGNLEDMAAPNLAAEDSWSRDFKVHDDPAPGRIEDGARVFRFTVRPKSAEPQALPAVRINYFNPKTRKYEDAFTERVALEVVDAARLDSSEIVDASTGTASRELEAMSGGLEANYSGPDLLEPHGPYRLSRGGWTAVWSGPPLVWCTVLLARRWAAARRLDPARRRAGMALHRALQRLDHAAATPPEAPCDRVARALSGYLADRLDRPAAELTPAEARHDAVRLGAGAELAARVEALLGQCDQLRFARHAPGLDADALIGPARQVLEELEQAAGRGVRQAAPSAIAGGLLLIGLFALSGGAGAAFGDEAPDRRAVLEQANAAFERGSRSTDPASARESFRQAVDAYRSLVDSGVENGHLYYNLANAYFRVGDVPRAILFYRCAERLLPRDRQIAANLAFARSRVPDRIGLPESGRLRTHLLFAHYDWSVRERMGLAIGSFALGWLFWTARLGFPRAWLSAAGSLALLCAAGLGYSAYVSMTRDSAHPIGVVVAQDVIVRKGDGATYEPQFNRPIGPGVELRRIAQRGDWAEIELLDGKRGWVRVEQLSLAPGGRE